MGACLVVGSVCLKAFDLAVKLVAQKDALLAEQTVELMENMLVD